MLSQIIVAGVSMGLVYALIAVGFQVVVQGTGVFNFAHGEFVAIGTLAYFSLSQLFPGHPELFFPLTIAAIAGLSVIIGLLIFSSKVSDPLRLAILTVGFATILRGIAGLSWGHDVLFAPPVLTGSPLMLGDVVIPLSNLVLAVVGIAILAAVHALFTYTYWGKRILASALNPDAASLVGIDLSSTRIKVFLIAGTLAGAAGALVAPITFASAESGFMFVLKAFAAALLGGLDRFLGPLAGGLFLGILEAVVAGYVSSSLRDAIVFGVIFLVLIWRPSGLLGARSGRSA